MPGYGDFQVPSALEFIKGGIETRELQRKSQLEQAVQPLLMQLAPMEAQEKMASAQARTAELQDSLIARAATTAQNAEEWDASMEDLAAKGVTAARPLVGRYSPDRKKTVLDAFGGATSVKSAETGGGRSRGGGGQAADDSDPTAQYEMAIAAMKPEEQQALHTKAQGLRDSVQRVLHSSDPQSQWNEEVVKWNQPSLIGQDWREGIKPFQQQISAVDSVLGENAARGMMGIPGRTSFGHAETVGGQKIWVEPNPTGGPPKVTPLTEKQYKPVLVGTDAAGNPVFADPDSGEMTPHEGQITPKATGAGSRGGRGAGGGSVWSEKHAAWLAAHPGDEEGALKYANSMMGKDYSNDKAYDAAYGKAEKEYSDADLMGHAPPGDKTEWVEKRAADLYRNMTVAEDAKTPAQIHKPVGSVDFGPIKGITPQMASALQRIAPAAARSKAKVGTPENPAVPTTQAQYDKLPVGSVYLRADGATVRKKKP